MHNENTVRKAQNCADSARNDALNTWFHLVIIIFLQLKIQFEDQEKQV